MLVTTSYSFGTFMLDTARGNGLSNKQAKNIDDKSSANEASARPNSSVHGRPVSHYIATAYGADRAKCKVHIGGDASTHASVRRSNDSQLSGVLAAMHGTPPRLSNIQSRIGGIFALVR